MSFDRNFTELERKFNLQNEENKKWVTSIFDTIDHKFDKLVEELNERLTIVEQKTKCSKKQSFIVPLRVKEAAPTVNAGYAGGLSDSLELIEANTAPSSRGKDYFTIHHHPGNSLPWIQHLSCSLI